MAINEGVRENELAADVDEGSKGMFSKIKESEHISMTIKEVKYAGGRDYYLYISRKKRIDIISERIVLGKKEQLHYCKPREEEEAQM